MNVPATTTEDARHEAVEFALARLVWAWLQSDEAVVDEEWRAAWGDLHVDNQAEDEAREDLLVAALLDLVAGYMRAEAGSESEVQERARLWVRRTAHAERLVHAALGAPASPSLGAAAPLDETLT
jgi:hypothetical protein